MTRESFLEPSSPDTASARGGTVGAAVYRLQAFGDTRLFASDGSDSTPRGRKTRALLVFLLLNAGTALTRERLASLLWGDSGDEQARASLRQALYELRRLSNATAPLLSAGREQISAESRFLSIDIEGAEAFAKTGDLAALISSLPKQPLALFTDLDDITPEFDDWLRGERTRRIERLVKSTVSAGVAALEQADVDAVRELAATLEALDPLCEPAVRLGMEADLRAGDPTSAHRRYKRFETRLRQELDTAPAVETRALLSRAPESTEESPGALNGHHGLNGHSVAPLPPPRNPEPSADLRSVEKRLPTLRRRPPRSKLAWAVVLLIALLSSGGLFFYTRQYVSTPSIAILPFDEMPPRVPNNYFASGISEEILNLLARNPKLRVLGSTSARLFAAHPDARDVSRSLGVSHLLEGSVRSQGDRVRVSVRLVRADDGTQLWVEEYDRALGDIFQVQQEIGTAVAQHLASSLAPIPGPHQTTRAQVYDRYLQAVALMRDRTESSLTEARTMLLETVALDPNYAATWAALSIATMLLSDQPASYGSIPVDVARSQATQYAQRALALAPDMGAPHAAFGLASSRSDEAIEHYRQAIALEPQRGEFHRWLGQAYADAHRSREALEEYRRSAELEPLWEPAAEQLIDQLAFMGREHEIDAVVKRFATVSRTPHDVDWVRLVGYQLQGRLEETALLADRMLSASPEDPAASDVLAILLAALGERRKAFDVLPAAAMLKRAVVNHDIPHIESLATEQPGAFWRLELKNWRVAELLVARGRAAQLLQWFDAKYGTAERFWTEEQVAAILSSPALIVALRAQGRTREADFLNASVLNHIEADIQSGVPARSWAFERAQQRALAGQTAAALSDLELLTRSSSAFYFRQTPFLPLSERVAFRALRSHPRLLALQRELNGKLRETRRRLATHTEAEWLRPRNVSESF